MSSIFGGSKQKSQQQSTSTQESGNRAFGWAQSNFDPMVQVGNQAGSFLSRLLGLNGDPAADAAYQQYKDSAGYKSTMDSGVNAIRQAGLGTGSFNSGRTAKRLMEFGQDTEQKYYDNFLSRLFNLSGQGLDAGRSIIGAGQYSTGQSQSSGSSSGSSNNGMGGFLGGILSGVAASDRRLKKDIVKIGNLKDGIDLYRFNYISGEGPYIGVMADEVAEYMPEALGPMVDGYMTVNYDALMEKENGS